MPKSQKILILVGKYAVCDLKVGFFGKPTTVRVYARNLREKKAYILEIASKYAVVSYDETAEGDLIFYFKQYLEACNFRDDLKYKVHTKG